MGSASGVAAVAAAVHNDWNAAKSTVVEGVGSVHELSLGRDWMVLEQTQSKGWSSTLSSVLDPVIWNIVQNIVADGNDVGDGHPPQLYVTPLTRLVLWTSSACSLVQVQSFVDG